MAGECSGRRDELEWTNYCMERCEEQLWRITAQSEGTVILQQANVKVPIGRQEVEAYFHGDLMKESPAG